MSFFEKSLSTLELPVVLKMLSEQAVSAPAKEECLSLKPSVEQAEVALRLEETSCACTMMTVRGSPSFSGVKDIRPSLARADLGGALNTRELLNIAALLRCARLVRTYVADDSVGKTKIDHLFSALRANKYLEEKITSSISGEDEISDSASSDLADIRRKMRAAAARAREALQKIISSPSYAKVLQEPIITMRSERYVVPVKAEYKNSVPGLVHDISATGATLFIEPMGAVKANNELRELAAKEKLEIERILAELSAECAAHRTDMESDWFLLVRLDVIFAKAKLSYALNCCAAAAGEDGILLRKARHPFLNRDTAVPIDVELGRGFDTMVITGSNTGGKTVALKTIGLLAAMNQCGLHIPASDGSTLPVFSHILADIGDEQSIEQNLSTFSAHMTNIVSILEECDEKSLVLFDEPGAGTDPAEGAALAVSIIEHVRAKGALIAATTHYTELKFYATNERGVINASCEFDIETLRPTYRLLMGIPGKSNAFAISRRLGLPDEIINDAKNRVSTENASFEATVEKLEQMRVLLEKDRDAERLKLREAEENAKQSARLKAELDVRLEKADVKARREAERILEEARETAEQVFSELDEMKKRLNEEDDIHRINTARNELRRRLNEAKDSLDPGSFRQEDTRQSAREIREGDVVEIRSMGIQAEVVSVSADRTLTLKAGRMTVTAKENEVYLLEGKSVKPKKNITSSGASLRASSFKPEIDLRGMESIEAVATAEQFIDGAVMAKVSPIRIIHGKGTGALRTAIHQMLKRNKAVRSFRLGVFGEGETGVTIVELK
ncbi:MAG: endonuclease MutS2 [Oscillospiraceae bacterium]|nr:endonuclease MutS2 [Oscillospiraceae bacterium]